MGRKHTHILHECVCLCVYCYTIYSGRQACGRASQGHTGGRSHRISPPSFCGACLNFYRENDAAVLFPRRPMDLMITILPVVTKDLPISPRFTPYNFLSRCKFSTLTTRQPMVEFHLLTFPRFPLRKKEHKSYFSKNRTHDFRTSRCAG